MALRNVERSTFHVKSECEFCFVEIDSLVFSLETSAKATSQQCAREVTKAFSVVSNRAGIRERSVFWVLRGAGREKQNAF